MKVTSAVMAISNLFISLVFLFVVIVFYFSRCKVQNFFLPAKRIFPTLKGENPYIASSPDFKVLKALKVLRVLKALKVFKALMHNNAKPLVVIL